MAPLRMGVGMDINWKEAQENFLSGQKYSRFLPCWLYGYTNMQKHYQATNMILIFFSM